ncbi:hypothetical protein MHBO_003687 [Bonamia ostreae]|uniref:Uncharacterized protein n=1 Tax=Bonamia ostreae TaxID=126728 RepID=A0ABV2AR73_9EUKA
MAYNLFQDKTAIKFQFSNALLIYKSEHVMEMISNNKEFSSDSIGMFSSKTNGQYVDICNCHHFEAGADKTGTDEHFSKRIKNLTFSKKESISGLYYVRRDKILPSTPRILSDLKTIKQFCDDPIIVTVEVDVDRYHISVSAYQFCTLPSKSDVSDNKIMAIKLVPIATRNAHNEGELYKFGRLESILTRNKKTDRKVMFREIKEAWIDVSKAQQRIKKIENFIDSKAFINLQFVELKNIKQKGERTERRRREVFRN